MQSTKIAIFYHIYQVNNWKEIFDEQYKLLKDSGLINISDYIYFGINGLNKINNIDDKIIQNLNELPADESPTLKSLYSFAKNNKDYYIMYIHTKGVTNSSEQMDDWRKYMNYFCIEKWNDCVSLLKEYDAVGCNYEDDCYYGYFPHFSGNFWWSKSSHIEKLNYEYLNTNFRQHREFWIGSIDGKFKEIHNSYTDHFKEKYKRSRYERFKRTRMKDLVLKEIKENILDKK